MKRFFAAIVLLTGFTAAAEKVTAFETGKGGVLWMGEKSGGKLSYAPAPDARGLSARLEWQEKKAQAVLVVDFWFPPLASTREKSDGVLKMSFLPGTGKERITLLTVKFMDAKGEIFQWRKAVSLKDAKGWQEISFEINPDTFADSYGKNADKKIDPPVRFYGIVVTFDNPVTSPGWIFFDDIEYTQN